MKYTKELHLQHVAAFWDGRLEVNRSTTTEPNWCPATLPPELELREFFRIKPEPKLRPWKQEEVPVGAIVGFKNGGQYLFKRLIIDNIVGCNLGEKEPHSLGELLRDYDHSTDGGKTWKPCGVEE